jgi:hypothetical protein
MGLVLHAIAFGCVDTDGERPDEPTFARAADPGSGPFNCAVDDAYEHHMLDDFELGAAAGTWYANNDICEDCQKLAEQRDQMDAPDAGAGDAGLDGEYAKLETRLAACREACDASQSPHIFDKPLPATRIPDEGRCGSQYALHLTTAKLIDWGANIGNNLAPPFDGTEWEGISFWARRAPESRGTVRVELADKHTDGNYIDEKGSPPCLLEFERDDLKLGCDRFGGYALVGPDWEFFKLPFSELRQAGWGVKAPEFDTAGLRTVTFLFPAGSWDIWIDDVTFYRRRAR